MGVKDKFYKLVTRFFKKEAGYKRIAEVKGAKCDLCENKPPEWCMTRRKFEGTWKCCHDHLHVCNECASRIEGEIETYKFGCFKNG